MSAIWFLFIVKAASRKRVRGALVSSMVKKGRIAAAIEQQCESARKIKPRCAPVLPCYRLIGARAGNISKIF
jgi:hypothetical protein